LSTTSSFDNEKAMANLSFMVSHDSNKKVSDFNSEYKPTYDELQNAFDKLHEETIKFARLISQ